MLSINILIYIPEPVKLRTVRVIARLMFIFNSESAPNINSRRGEGVCYATRKRSKSVAVHTGV
jgi:hypothetical protein